MSGAWEILKNPTVLTAFLHTDLVTVPWALGFRNLIINGPIMPIAGMPYDMARNRACMAALEMGVDHLFFIDSDVIAPRDVIPRLIRRRKDVVSGVYHRRSPPVGVPVMQKPAGQWIMSYPQNALIEVDVVGAGCLLLSRNFLQKFQAQRPESGKHWFDWRVDCEGLYKEKKVPPHQYPMSEDFTMCMEAKRQGFGVFVDTSIQCRHIGLAQSTYARFDPCDCTPNT